MQRQIDMTRTLESSARQPLPFSGPESLFPTWKQCLGQARLNAELQGSYWRGIDAYSEATAGLREVDPEYALLPPMKWGLHPIDGYGLSSAK